MYIFFSGDTCHQAEAALTPAVNEQIPRLYYQTVTVVGVFVFDRILEYANITAGAGCHDVCIIFVYRYGTVKWNWTMLLCSSISIQLATIVIGH